MAPIARKIINDPVHGFITIEDSLIMDIISHPYYQRLSRIRQMALAYSVYPGAVHSRLHHSLGAYHLMCIAINELKAKGTKISKEEAQAAKAAILLHDIGHGPFSHALEHIVIKGVSHEQLSIRIMELMNEDLNGQLSLAIEIFKGNYERTFLHQLISGQIDMDRMDYLSRDSFFTGVSEGVIGYDRLLKMLVVQDNELMIEEKGIYSVEKFLIARRQMYWQVYMHKTVLSAEKMLVQIMRRAKTLYKKEYKTLKVSSVLDFFMKDFTGDTSRKTIEKFCQLDDSDILSAVKHWQNSTDPVLSQLCYNLLYRRLLKCKIQGTAFDEGKIKKKFADIKQKIGLTEDELSYIAFEGIATNTTYKPLDENIKIYFKNGKIKDISEVDNALISNTLSIPVEKYFVCYPKHIEDFIINK